MKNKYFPEEEIQKDDLYFMCYMIERVSRKLHQKNKYVINSLGQETLYHLISIANVLHSENPLSVEDRWIEDYNLEYGNFYITDIDKELVDDIPSPTQIGKVYQRLILDTLLPEEDYVEGMIRIYNSPICSIIDNYNCSAYYEPSYVVARAYQAGGFQ